jgi:hypothetical protein
MEGGSAGNNFADRPVYGSEGSSATGRPRSLAHPNSRRKLIDG